MKGRPKPAHKRHIYKRKRNGPKPAYRRQAPTSGASLPSLRDLGSTLFKLWSRQGQK